MADPKFSFNYKKGEKGEKGTISNFQMGDYDKNKYCFNVSYKKNGKTITDVSLTQIRAEPEPAEPAKLQSGGLITMKSKKTKKQSGGFPRVSDMQPYKT